MSQQQDLLVVTSAGGIQCQHLIPLIYQKYNLRLVVRSESSRDRLRTQFPNADVVQADIAEPAQCKEILKDATRVYHVGPSLHPHEAEIGFYMIDAALTEHQRTGNFKHFVFSSVLNAQLRKMFNHDRKRYIEEYLIESGLNYTILNPCDFLNFAFPVKHYATMEKPEHLSVMGVDVKSAFVVLEDYSEATAKILAEGEKHYQAQYQMCSMPPVSYGQVAEDIGRALGKDLPIKQTSPEDAIVMLSGFLTKTLGEDSPAVRDGAERLVLYYRRRGLPGNPNVMEWILGRKPTSHIEWIDQQLKGA